MLARLLASHDRRYDSSMDLANRFCTAIITSLAEAAPYLVIGYLVVALIREFVSTETLTRHLGERGVRPLLKALGIGALLPVCSCGSIPIGVGLARSGAGLGTVLALMTSSPSISPVSVALGYTLLGPKLLVTFLATVLVGAFLIGWFGNALLQPPRAAAKPDKGSDNCCDTDDLAATGGSIRRALRWAYGDLGADVSVDLLVGLSVAAAITAFLPHDWTTALLGGSSAWAMLAVVVVSIPLYTCSVPAMLIMHSLLLGGASPGSAVAFLIAGPASNLGELNAIRGSMGGRTAVYYSFCLVVVALAGGILADRLLFRDGDYAPPAASAMAAEYVPAWHYPFMIVLVAVIIYGLYRRVQRQHSPTCS
jgi:uncharacterized protein